MNKLTTRGIGMCNRFYHHGAATNIFKRQSWAEKKPTVKLFSTSYDMDEDETNFHINTDIIPSLPAQYLRECDVTNYNPTTFQRNDVKFDIHSGKPLLDSNFRDNEKIDDKYVINFVTSEGDECEITWGDGHVSRYSLDWLLEIHNHWKNSNIQSDRTLWKNLNEQDVRQSKALSLTFDDALSDGGSRALKALYRYGILLVTNTPVDDGGVGVAALGASLSGGQVKNKDKTSLLASYRKSQTNIMLPHGTDGPLRTLYGTVWSTTSSGQADGASVADSAYDNGGLPLHTDMTYYRDPPGLQIFTMVNPAVSGGESIFADGFAVAEELRYVDPYSFQILRSTVRRYQCIDETTGWNLQASGCVIETETRGRVIGIRHNDLDRLPDLPPLHYLSTKNNNDDYDRFYNDLKHAHHVWDTLLAQDRFRLVMKLEKGDTVVVANHRCFHGRKSFVAPPDIPRTVIGCYTSQDDLCSRFRMEGFNV